MNKIDVLLAVCVQAMLVLIVWPLMALPAGASAPSYKGQWVTERYGSVVEIAPCGPANERVCAEIIWLWESLDASGQPMKDAENGDRSLRERPLLGINIFEDMNHDAVTGFAKGKIYNPEDGRSYSASIKQVADDTLLVEGCIVFLCQTQYWRRPESLPRFERTVR